jgi:hypothetical protein
MKKQSTSLFTQMSVNQFKHLTTIVTETVATEFNDIKEKKFTAAVLWNIQRQGKRRIQRRYSL